MSGLQEFHHHLGEKKESSGYSKTQWIYWLNECDIGWDQLNGKSGYRDLTKLMTQLIVLGHGVCLSSTETHGFQS